MDLKEAIERIENLRDYINFLDKDSIDRKALDIVLNEVKSKDSNKSEAFKEGDHVTIIGNSACHGFENGEEVVLCKEYISTWHAKSLDGKNDWYVGKEDIKKGEIKDDFYLVQEEEINKQEHEPIKRMSSICRDCKHITVNKERFVCVKYDLVVYGIILNCNGIERV
jgi:hypothetical protein